LEIIGDPKINEVYGQSVNKFTRFPSMPSCKKSEHSLSILCHGSSKDPKEAALDGFCNLEIMK
jgi:hypothetical protein